MAPVRTVIVEDTDDVRDMLRLHRRLARGRLLARLEPTATRAPTPPKPRTPRATPRPAARARVLPEWGSRTYAGEPKGPALTIWEKVGRRALRAATHASSNEAQDHGAGPAARSPRPDGRDPTL